MKARSLHTSTTTCQMLQDLSVEEGGEEWWCEYSGMLLGLTCPINRRVEE